MIVSEWFYLNKYTKIRRLGDRIIINQNNCDNQIHIETVKKFCDICKVLLNVKDIECEYESNYVDKKVE